MSVTFKSQTVVAAVQKIRGSMKVCDRGTCGMISFQLDSHLRAWCFSLKMIFCTVVHAALCFRTMKQQISVSFKAGKCYGCAAFPSMRR